MYSYTRAAQRPSPACSFVFSSRFAARPSISSPDASREFIAAASEYNRSDRELPRARSSSYVLRVRGAGSPRDLCKCHGPFKRDNASAAAGLSGRRLIVVIACTNNLCGSVGPFGRQRVSNGCELSVTLGLGCGSVRSLCVYKTLRNVLLL